MGRRGPGALPQVEKREQYARLIGQGFSSLEACRIVGINPRTGKRWRHGRTITARDGRKMHYSPVITRGAVVRREISDRYLSEQERVQIADLRAAGAGVRAIAERTGRSPSTISRELRRNRDPDSGQYRPFTAHKLAVQRRARRRPTGIIAMTMIDQRPAGAAGRSEPGHWEGDLITGASNRSAIGTLVDRASRYTILLHLPGRHTAEAVRDALITAFWHLPPQLRRSLTWDQGKEMALHAEITAALGMPVYFCEKASPWQRPSNENTNGLLRQYFPKGSDLRVHSADELATVAAELNARPRKTLAWDTPAARLGL